MLTQLVFNPDEHTKDLTGKESTNLEISLTNHNTSFSKENIEELVKK